jgi:hypothetical protein
MRRSARASTKGATYAIPEPDSDEFMGVDSASDDDEDAPRGRRGAAPAKAATQRRGKVGRSPGKKAAAAAKPAPEDVDSDDLMQPAESDDDDRDQDGSDDGEGGSSSDMDDDGGAGRGAKGRAGRPAAAAAAKPAGKPRGRPKKQRPAAAAAAQATQLLPAAMDEELLRSTWLVLPQKNRTHKDALAQGYRRQFPRWRLQLRWAGREGRREAAALGGYDMA